MYSAAGHNNRDRHAYIVEPPLKDSQNLWTKNKEQKTGPTQYIFTFQKEVRIINSVPKCSFLRSSILCMQDAERNVFITDRFVAYSSTC